VQTLVNNDANVFALGEFYFGQNISFRNLAPLSERKMYGAVDNPAAEETARPTAKSYKLVKKNTPLKAEEDLLGSDGADSTDENGIRETIKTASLVGLTIGTGLGAGLILNGRLYSGANCGAGEIGCLPYLDGNLEKYVSGAFFSNQGLDGKSCYALARNGDPKAIALYHAFGHHVGQAIKMAMYTYDPDSIVLGGSVSQAFDLFEKSMTDAIKDFDYPGILAKIKIYPSKLENSAILGAAALYYDAWK
jgi:predicted NBD/HSP70 family sugar kinase